MAKYPLQNKGSQYVLKRLGEDTAAVTVADLNKLIKNLTASTETLVALTGPAAGEAITDGILPSAPILYDPAPINNSFATLRVEIDKIKNILESAGLIDSPTTNITPEDLTAYSAWMICGGGIGDQVYLNEADTVLLTTAMEEGDFLVFTIDLEMVPDPVSYEENPAGPGEGENANWTFVELEAANITYLAECPELP